MFVCFVDWHSTQLVSLSRHFPWMQTSRVRMCLFVDFFVFVFSFLFILLVQFNPYEISTLIEYDTIDLNFSKIINYNKKITMLFEVLRLNTTVSLLLLLSFTLLFKFKVNHWLLQRLSIHRNWCVPVRRLFSTHTLPCPPW